MLNINNAVAFLTMNGFFIGIIFGILKLDDPFEMATAALLVTAVFYIFALAAASIFVKHIQFKPRYRIKKEHYESTIDNAISELEKRERMITDLYTFVRELEEEEFGEIKKEYLQTSGSPKRRT